MPDIAKCPGEGCKVRDTCYRYTSKPHELRQAYFMTAPGKDKGCDYYSPVKKGISDE